MTSLNRFEHQGFIKFDDLKLFSPKRLQSFKEGKTTFLGGRATIPNGCVNVTLLKVIEEDPSQNLVETMKIKPISLVAEMTAEKKPKQKKKSCFISIIRKTNGAMSYSILEDSSAQQLLKR